MDTTLCLLYPIYYTLLLPSISLFLYFRRTRKLIRQQSLTLTTLLVAGLNLYFIFVIVPVCLSITFPYAVPVLFFSLAEVIHSEKHKYIC